MLYGWPSSGEFREGMSAESSSLLNHAERITLLALIRSFNILPSPQLFNHVPDAL